MYDSFSRSMTIELVECLWVTSAASDPAGIPAGLGLM